MKPDWKDAPEWAKWLSMDGDGKWGWYENEPACGGFRWFARSGRYQVAAAAPAFERTKEGRP